MKEEIIAIVAEYLDVDASTLVESKTLQDLNIDSLDFVEILFEVEDKFDVSLNSKLQDRSDEIQNFGDVLRITEEMILQQRIEDPENNL